MVVDPTQKRIFDAFSRDEHARDRRTTDKMRANIITAEDAIVSSLYSCGRFPAKRMGHMFPNDGRTASLPSPPSHHYLAPSILRNNSAYGTFTDSAL